MGLRCGSRRLEIRVPVSEESTIGGRDAMSTTEFAMTDAAPPPAAASRKRETREERRARIAERVRTLPTEPGCYLMRDKAGEIFYVGKAGDLRARVRSYFSGSDTRQFVDWLDDLLYQLDVIVVRNPGEALLLERTLVRQHQPRFNVKLRDDKNFIHLRLDTRPTSDSTAPLRRRYPRVEVVRGPRDERGGVRLFGPYHSATAARSTLRVLNRHFQLRTCRDAVLENRARPCLQYQIGRCPGPCVYPVDGYEDALQDAALFLGGRRSELTERLQARMMDMAAVEDFEGAARVRDQLQALSTALDDQAVTDVARRRNQDVWAVARQASLMVVTRVVVRDGRMQGVDTEHFDRAEFPTEELFGSFVSQFYDDIDPEQLPDEVLLSLDLGVTSSLMADELGARRGRKVEVRVPQRGHNNKLIEIAEKNATTTMEELGRKQERKTQGLSVLQERLGLAMPPRVIECFDISLFQGTDAVASQVCFVDGAPDKRRYRRYSIKTVEGTDDFAMLYEAVTRRLRRGKETGDLPDLLIVDGGKGQLNVAITACRDLGVRIVNAVGGDGLSAVTADGATRPSVALASIAKARSFNTRSSSKKRNQARPLTPREDRAGLADDDDALQMSPERLFVPGAKDPLTLRPHTADRFLIEQLRDEAHRFAITAHRAKRKKRTLRSVLDEIPGVGLEKRKALLKALGSVQAVADADEATLAAVGGIGPRLASRIREALNGVDGPRVSSAAAADTDANTDTDTVSGTVVDARGPDARDTSGADTPMVDDAWDDILDGDDSDGEDDDGDEHQAGGERPEDDDPEP